MSAPTNERRLPTREFGIQQLNQPASIAQTLASCMLEAASTQEPGTPLYGYPGGTPQAEAVQLGILAYECTQVGIHPEVIAEASRYVLQAWAERRRNQ